MFAYDNTFDPKVVLGQYDLISWFSDFPLYLGTQLVYEHTSYVPPPKELGDILFLVWIPSASASASSAAWLFVCAISPEPLDGFRPNWHRNFIGTAEWSD